jgi:hypothetical protein
MKKIVIALALFPFVICLVAADPAQDRQSSVAPPVALNILSANTLSGTAGDYVTVEAEIKNETREPINDITTYLSLVDLENKLPVDLEDWSAEKGLNIGTIETGQSLPLKWKIHFVKAGEYSLVIVANLASEHFPVVSRITKFNVRPKHNLNPGQVLPVALGTPIVLLFVLFVLSQRRRT